jgi:hypothetical protein
MFCLGDGGFDVLWRIIQFLCYPIANKIHLLFEGCQEEVSRYVSYEE